MGRTAMFSSERDWSRRPGLLAAALAAAALAGCSTPPGPQPTTFGEVLHEDILAQIADPDAEAAVRPPAPTSGARVGLAIKRYETGKVYQPLPATATRIGAEEISQAPPPD